MVLDWAGYGWTLGFALSGLALMLIGLYLFDVLVPFQLFQEVENGNQAVGWMAAGFLISTGIILGEAFRGNAGWVQGMGHAILGILLNYLGYYLWEWFTPRWSLTDSLKKGAVAAGITLFGIFVAVGLIIAGSFS
ncbi:MAG: DUF350 domain-containing protein [Mycobacterium leprae]